MLKKIMVKIIIRGNTRGRPCSEQIKISKHEIWNSKQYIRFKFGDFIWSLIKEIFFISKLVFVNIISSCLSFGVMYLLMDKWVGKDYRTAFQVISAAYDQVNFYIATAVLAQFVISCLIVCFLALHYSHRIAGPIYRIKLTVRQYLQGQDIKKLSFRNTDFFHGVAENFTDFFNLLQKRKKFFEETRGFL